ncbi:hypothetical protein A2U01_0050377, partial [Trifolium medium]|nr:hypothetical protein [Trifolium medium]
HFVGEQHVFVAKALNDEAPSKLLLDFTTTFATPEADERLSDDIVTVKDLEDNCNVPPSIFQSSCDSDRVESLTIQSIVDVPIGLVPSKHRSIFPTRPLLLPYRFTVLTNKDGNTLSKATKREVPNHMIFDNNFDHSFDFPVECTFNFDPGGDERRVLAAILGNS